MTDAPTGREEPRVPAVTVAELLPRLDRGERLLLLDVRNDDEFGRWRVEARRAVETVHLPYFEFIEEPEASIARVPRGREVVVLCAHGDSSEMVAEMLLAAGIPSANVTGGMVAYGSHLEPARVAPARSSAPGLEIWQVNRRGRACLSYVVMAGGEAVVVDPSRHVEWYVDFAEARGARIVRVLDTHVHADHVSGGPALARQLGVPYFVAAGEGFDLRQPVTPLADADRIRVGGGKGMNLEVRVLATPGHTPGSTSYLVDGSYLLSGDTLFVGGVGRPDLGGRAVEWGRALFDTLKRTLAGLSPDTVVLPAHYGGTADIGTDGVVSRRLGELRRSVAELRIDSAEAFVAALRGAVHDPPRAYAEIVKVNLGADASPDQMSEWELGKNACASAGGSTGA
jgi:glyoxylase-like metal-dependent hydrolase (beta-lactamase superfamily II)